MKTSELTGAALDWAVAKCEGYDCNGKALTRPDPLDDGALTHLWLKQYNPSTNWAQGGPIIEREGLCVQPYCGLYEYDPIVEWESFVMARCFENEHPHGVGPTPLIAAMELINECNESV
jgi:hypothetical protein